MTDSFRRPQPRPAPPHDPAVESWLNTLPPSTVKPSPEELRQWKLDDDGDAGKGWFIAAIILRVLSLVFALTTTFLNLSFIASKEPSVEQRIIAVLVVCPAIAVWDAAEFVTLCVLQGRGISHNVHVWAYSLLFIAAATATANLVVDVIDGITEYGPYGKHSVAAKEIAATCLMIGLMVIQSFFIFFFVCHTIEKREKRRTTPRIMYRPTREPVVGTANPAPPTPTTNQQLAQQNTQRPVPEATNRSAQTSATEETARQGIPHSPTYYGEPSQLPGMPRRKPAPPRANVGSADTHYATPSPENHTPDEAESSRAARGEDQARWMTLHGMEDTSKPGPKAKTTLTEKELLAMPPTTYRGSNPLPAIQESKFKS
ncbi:hypothetical protein QBC46DRAFT_452570 [Diplogelasinospora grovesii]|uniref:Uncharacterized protein n=1 Tax=Diplogelasinospora grovesii TaxID=303347 RepID=A0AAN6N1H0_9PEZI|nr:hypothetical protein QBC46DRAFT_452570 [Diplogelasinospora grovesii]